MLTAGWSHTFSSSGTTLCFVCFTCVNGRFRVMVVQGDRAGDSCVSLPPEWAAAGVTSGCSAVLADLGFSPLETSVGLRLYIHHLTIPNGDWALHVPFCSEGKRSSEWCFPPSLGQQKNSSGDPPSPSPLCLSSHSLELGHVSSRAPVPEERGAALWFGIGLGLCSRNPGIHAAVMAMLCPASRCY